MRDIDAPSDVLWLDDPATAGVIGPRASRYLETWRKMTAKAGGEPDRAERQLSWNTAAFLFSGVWLFYRKLWLRGVLLIAINSVALLAPSRLVAVATGITMGLVVGLRADGLVMARTRRLVARGKAEQWSVREMARAGGVSRVGAALALLIAIAFSAVARTDALASLADTVLPTALLPGETAATDGGQTLDCTDKDGVADALGSGQLLELTDAQEAFYDQAYKTQYCTAHAVTRSGSGNISYRLHEADDGDIITEVRPGADGFHVQAAQILGVSPQKLDDTPEQKIAALVQVAQVAGELAAANAAEAAKTPARRAYEAFHQSCSDRFLWVPSHIHPAAERAAKLREMLQGYAGANPQWLEDRDRDCAAEYEAAAAFLEAGGEYNPRGSARGNSYSVTPQPDDFQPDQSGSAATGA